MGVVMNVRRTANFMKLLNTIRQLSVWTAHSILTTWIEVEPINKSNHGHALSPMLERSVSLQHDGELLIMLLSNYQNSNWYLPVCLLASSFFFSRYLSLWILCDLDNTTSFSIFLSLSVWPSLCLHLPLSHSIFLNHFFSPFRLFLCCCHSIYIATWQPSLQFYCLTVPVSVSVFVSLVMSLSYSNLFCFPTFG